MKREIASEWTAKGVDVYRSRLIGKMLDEKIVGKKITITTRNAMHSIDVFFAFLAPRQVRRKLPRRDLNIIQIQMMMFILRRRERESE